MQRMGTRSYLAEQAMADATVRPGPDDGRVVVNVNCLSLIHI